MNTRHEELHDFFGAHFHQDWMTEHESTEEVTNAFLTEPDIDFLRRVQQQLNLLLHE